MKKILLALLMVAVSAAGAWGITELDATVPANNALISTFAAYERETRAKINELINAGMEAAVTGVAMLSTYADFSTALTTIGSTPTTLIVNEDVTISADTTIPSNVQLVCTNGNTMTVASGKVLTINGPFLCGLQQIFDGPGTVELTNMTEVYPEWWGGLGDGTSDDSAEVRAAMLALPAKGGKVRFSCKNWTFNLVVDQPNIWLDGCGATSNTYWNTGQWQAYDTTLPIVKVTSVAYGTGVKANTGFQLTNAHLNGANSDGVKYGQKGLHVRSSEYHNISNVNIEYFVTYGILFGDSDLTVDEWVYFGNFSNMTVKAHNTRTTGDTIKLIQSGGQVTSQYFSNLNLYGPFSGSGYALNNVTEVRFTNSYMQVNADQGLYKDTAAVSGKYQLVNVTVEGPSPAGGDWEDDNQCIITSTHASPNAHAYFSVLQASNVTITGSYCDGDGNTFRLYGRPDFGYESTMSTVSILSALKFHYGGSESFERQQEIGRRVFIQRTVDDGLNIYAAGGTLVQAGDDVTQAFKAQHPTYAVYAQGLSGGTPILAAHADDDNGSSIPLAIALRLFRSISNRIDGSSVAADGFGVGIDTYLYTGAGGLDQALAGRLSNYWLDSDGASLDSSWLFAVRTSNHTANGSCDALEIRDNSLIVGPVARTNGTQHQILTYFTDAAGTRTASNAITSTMDDATAGSIDTTMAFNTMQNGTSSTRARVTNRGFAISEFAVAGASATCSKGEITFDNSTIYVCVDTDTWRKATIASW